MIRLKTKQEVKYDSRGQKSGVVYFELRPIKSTDGYNCTVIDSVEKTVTSQDLDGNDVTGTYSEQLFTRNIFISNAEINAIFAVVEPSLPSGLSYLQKEDVLFTEAFLYYMINDFLLDENGDPTTQLIYGLTPADFEIV